MQCKQCGVSFSLKTTLFHHLKTHNRSNSYTCGICTKKFLSVRTFTAHLKTHVETKNQFRCNSCNKIFNTADKAKRHYEEVHDQNPECEQLKVPLVNTPNGLLPISANKTQLDPKTKPYSCQLCNTRFSKMSNLNRHMFLHNDQRKYRCSVCSKRFNSQQSLDEHKAVHSDLKTFQCNLCEKVFKTSTLLKRHTLTHSTDKPFVCPYCMKTFKTIALCRKHINIHKKDVYFQVGDIFFVDTFLI